MSRKITGGQRKAHSIIEVCSGTLLGFGIALMTQIVVFPWFGIDVGYPSHLAITVIFTVVSLVRGYVVRRLFNYIHVKFGGK